MFDKRPNGSFRLFVDYQDFNNITIKNQYSLPIIGESLNCLDRAKQFIYLDLTNAYYRIKIKKDEK